MLLRALFPCLVLAVPAQAADGRVAWIDDPAPHVCQGQSRVVLFVLERSAEGMPEATYQVFSAYEEARAAWSARMARTPLPETAEVRCNSQAQSPH